MNKPWVGYLSSTLILLAGILMIAGGEMAVGIFFIVLAVAGFILKFYINSKKQ